MDILEKLADLQKQATTENSHYYVAGCCEEAMNEIRYLRWKCNNKGKPLMTVGHKIAETYSRDLGDAGLANRLAEEIDAAMAEMCLEITRLRGAK